MSKIFHFDPSAEFYTDEKCFIIEMSNSSEDEALSIARARVEPGVTTRLHRVIETVERYVILEGSGIVEVGKLPPEEVGVGDVVVIPSGVPQRISNTGENDLIFLALCTPRFITRHYQDIENSSD